jgi:uncharacterized protein
MTEQVSKPEIQHNIAKNRFELPKDGSLAVLEYKLRGDTITFTHTGVPSELEGRGLGSLLARAGMEYAREKTLKVATTCWFVTGYLERHAEYQDLLKT